MPPKIKYANPPVIEMVCSAQFEAIPLGVTHIGLFWSELKEEFPDVEQKAPLQTVIESQKPVAEQQWIIQTEVLPRVWFRNANRTSLIQIQNNRFVANWQRSAETPDYPSFDVLYPTFESYLARFAKFLGRNGLGPMQFNQFELTYINHIDPTNGLDAFGQERLFVDHMRDDTRDRFLPSAETVGWRSSYQLPSEMGRLHVSANTAIAASAPDTWIIKFELTARGIGDKSADGRRKWFDLAHEWITRGFADLTNPSAQQEFWKRLQ
jgi:uncharacterized protein (TIGR04255 family)